MIDYMRMLREFHEKYNHPISNKKFDGDKYPSFSTRLVVLRERLITKEAKEFRDWSYEMYDTVDTIPVNIIELADALGDLLYVVFGAALTYGIPIEEVFTEIHRSNMSKTIEKDSFGKTVKGPNWEPPKIREVLEKAAKND